MADENPAARHLPRQTGTGWYLTVAILVLLVGAFLRLHDLSETPIGLAPDELINTQLVSQLLDGNLTLIYDSVSPAREGTYHMLLALTSTIYGRGLMLWRLPSVWLGLLSIAMTIRLMRELFGVRVALMTGGLMAVLFWPVWLGRSVLHVTLMPPLVALAFFTFARAYRAPHLTQSSLWFTVGGLVLGFTLYAHVTAWTLIVILSLFVIYRAIVHRAEFEYHWSNLLYSLGLVLVLSLPLTIFLINHPGVREPVPLSEQPNLIASLPGRLLSTASALGLRGDTLLTHNLPGRPIMGPVIFSLAVIGVGVALARWRRPEYGFVLLWAAIGLIPVALLPEINLEVMVVVLPVLFAFPAIGVRAIYQAIERALERSQQRRAAAISAGLASIVLVGLAAGFTYRDYFVEWAQVSVTAFDQPTARLARYLDTSEDPSPVTVCSFPHEVAGSPFTITDEAYLETLMHRQLPIRYFDCRSSLVIADGGRTQRMVFPGEGYTAHLPPDLLDWMRYADNEPVPGIAPDIVMRFEASDVLADRLGAFITTAPTAWPPEAGTPRLADLPVTFDFNMAFLGYSLPDSTLQPSDSVELVTFWRVNGPPPRELTMFAHLLSNPVIVLGQADDFGAETGTLHPRDIVIQHTEIPTPAGIGAGLYPVSVGLYFPGSDERLEAFEQGQPVANRLFLQRVEVIEP